MIIPYSSTQIGARPGGPDDLEIDETDVLDAAVGVGLHPGWGIGPARRTAFDANWRIDLVRAVVDWSSGHIHKTRLYSADLDPTEKGFASYHLGMTLAFAWARAELQIPLLAHVDRLLTAGGQPVRGTRPDLVGTDASGSLFAFEAKGRSGPLSNAIETGKNQIADAHYWFQLGGTAAIGVVTAIYFPSDTSPMRMAVADPRTDAPAYTLDEDVIRAAALEPYAEAIVQQPTRVSRLGAGLVGSEIGDTGVIVALAPEAQAALDLPERRQGISERVAAVRPIEFQTPAEPPRRSEPSLNTGRLRSAELAGVDDYRTVGARLSSGRTTSEPISHAEYAGRISPSGVAILVDERWR